MKANVRIISANISALERWYGASAHPKAIAFVMDAIKIAGDDVQFVEGYTSVLSVDLLEVMNELEELQVGWRR